MKLQLFLNPSDFLIEYYGKEAVKAQFNLHEMYLMKNELEIEPALAMQIERHLNEKPIMYQTTNVSMRTIFLHENKYDTGATTIFTSRAPRRLIVSFIPAKNYLKTAQNCTPFTFAHSNVSNIYITYNARTIPSRPLDLSFAKDNPRFTEAFVNLTEAMGLGDKTNSLTPAMFQEGHAFFAFELSPSYHDNLRDLVQFSNVILRASFKEPIQQGGVYCICYAEFDTTVGVDRDRNPISISTNVL